MKSIKFLTSFIAILAMSAIFYACDSDDEKKLQPLTFEKSNYTILNSIEYPLTIRSGNGDYDFVFGDPSMGTASYEPAYTGNGNINVTCLRNGKTTLTIIDKISGENIKLNLTIVDSHLPIYIGQCSTVVEIDNTTSKSTIEKEILDKSIIQNQNVLLLKKNEKKDFYLLSKNEGSRSKVIHQGSYKFEEDNNKYYLILQYVKDENAIQKQKIQINNTENGFLVFSNFFKLDWHKSRMKADLKPDFLLLLQDLTEQYKMNYPILTVAALTFKSSILSPYSIILDIESDRTTKD